MYAERTEHIDFIFYQSSQNHGYKMVVNAVPPRLAWYIAMQFKQAFIEAFSGAKLEKVAPIRKTSIADISKQYPSNIVENKPITQHLIDEGIDPSKNVLISLVKLGKRNPYCAGGVKILPH